MAADSHSPIGRLRPLIDGPDDAMAALRGWGARIASTSAVAMPSLCELYASSCGGGGGGAADLEAEIYAHAPVSGGAKQLLLTLMRREPCSFSLRALGADPDAVASAQTVEELDLEEYRRRHRSRDFWGVRHGDMEELPKLQQMGPPNKEADQLEEPRCHKPAHSPHPTRSSIFAYCSLSLHDA